jgi:hypothetical protein
LSFSDPATATGIEWKELNGSLLLFTVHSHEHDIKTVHGNTSAIRADVVVLDGEYEGTVYVDTLVFPKVLQTNLKAAVGGKLVLGRLGQGQKKPSQSPPWILNTATPADKKTAQAYLDAQKDIEEDDTPF